MKKLFQNPIVAVGVLILDAGLRLLRRLPRKPLPLGILAVSLALMLLVNFGALRLSSVVLMLGAAAVSLAVFAARRRGEGKR